MTTVGSQHFRANRAFQFIALLINLLVALTVCSLPSNADEDGRVDAMRKYFANGEFGAVLREYEQCSPETRQKPIVCQWVGQSYLRRHDFRNAEPMLQRAAASDLGPQMKERAQDACNRINILKQLCPPFYQQYKLGGYTINLFAVKTQWSQLIAAQLPVFLSQAQEAFGDQSAEVNFYLLEDRTAYDQFFSAWTAQTPSKGHRGTGGMHIVMFCRYYPTGKQVGQNDINDLYFRVLHEYSHALCNTTYGDNYGRDVPQWLNEGMADYFGWRYKPAGPQEALANLRKLAANKPPQSYEDISKRLYEETGNGYTMGDVIVTQLFQGKPISLYEQIIDAARTDGGDFDAAVQQVTGHNPRSIYDSIVHTYRGAK
jgi:hypothetical protein